MPFDSISSIKVYITSPRGKEHLVETFKKTGVIVVSQLEEDVRLIVPTVDEELPFFASAKDWFESKGIKVLVASPFTIDTCRDKAEFNLFCQRHGFQTPRTWHLDGFLKPRFGKGSRGITQFNRSFIVQETCPFPEISIDYFSDFDGNILSIIPRYRLDVVNGESHAMMLVDNFDYEKVTRLGKELGLIGHNVIQGYWTGDVFIVGEVNPRYGGGSWLTFEKFNSPQWIVDHLKEKVKI